MFGCCLRPEEMQIARFEEVWNNLGQKGNKKEKWDVLHLFAIVCWNIWKARNAWVFWGVRMKETRICAIAAAEFHDFCNAVTVP